jgi:peptidyl-prolyl cis-trans isomerase D
MLEALHNASKSWFFRIFFAVLILSFVSWGGMSDMFNKMTSDTTAADVGGERISIKELGKDFEQEVKRLNPLFGGKLTNEQARQIGLMDRSLDKLIGRTLIMLEARRQGLAVGLDDLKKAIYTFPAFQGENGKFDRNIYQMTLANNRLSEDEFLRLMQGDIIQSQLLGSVAGAVPVPLSLIDQMAAFRLEKRIADVLIADAGSMPNPPAPSETDLAEFHKANAPRFTAPEFRSLMVLHLTQGSLSEETRPSDAEIEESYRVRIDEFSSPEKRIVLQMMFDSQDKAREAAQRLEKGDVFAKVAKDMAGMDDQAILLGRIERRDLPAELAAAAFALPKDGVTQPIKSSIGWHILKVTGITPTTPKPLSEVKAQIAHELAQDNAAKALNSLSAQIIDEVAGGAHLDEAAKRFNIKLSALGPLDAKGRDPFGAPVKKIPAQEKLLELAFATPEGADSQIVELDDGILGLKVVKVTPSALKPLGEVQAAVKAGWLEVQKRKMAEERAAKALDKLKAGAGIAAVAQEFGLKSRTTPAFLRDAPASEHGLPPKLVADIFKAKPGEVSMAATQDGAMIAKLGKIVPADAKENPDQRTEIAQALEQGLAADLIDQYTAALAKNFGVKKHEAAINKFFAQP